MIKKLKRFFAMTLAASMFMSQSSVAAFAEELKIATGANATYKVFTDSNSESKPVTGSNASIESGTIDIQGKHPMMFGMRGMLPDTVEVTELALVSVVDGTPRFDDNNNPGNDKDESNGILRTLDTVTYNLRMAIQEPENPTREGGEDKIWFKAVIPGRKAGEVQFLTESMEWLNDAEVTEEDDGLTLIGYTEVNGGETSVYWQDYSVPMKAYQMNQGEKFAPEFYAWVDGQDERVSVTDGTEITVSAKEALNLSLKFDSLSEKGYFDFAAVNSSVANTEVGEVHGSVFGLTLRAEVLSERNDLKGVKMPKGPIKFDIDLSLTNDQGATVDITKDSVPLLWDYLQVETGDETIGEFKRKLMSSVLGKTLLPYAAYNSNNPESSVYDSGKMTVSQEGATLHVVIHDYDFADEVVFPKKTISGNNYGQQQGVFSCGLIQIVVPYKTTDKTLYTVKAVIDQVTLNDQAIDQVTNVDDSASGKVQAGTGKYNQMVALSHKDEYRNMPTRIELGDRSYSGVSQGISYAYPGEEIYVTWSAASSDFYSHWNGADILVKIPNEFELPEKDEIEVFTTAFARTGNHFGLDKADDCFDEVRVRYVAKPNGEGWASEEEMDRAGLLDLVCYDSKEEAKRKGAKLLGVVAELRDGDQYNMIFRIVCTMPVGISDSAKIGYVYPFCHETYLYDVKPDAVGNALSLKHGLTQLKGENLDDINTRIAAMEQELCDTYVTSESNIMDRLGSNYGKVEAYEDKLGWFTYEYVKSSYLDGEVTSGTHLSYYGSGTETTYGQFGGNSLLIVGTEATIEKDIEQLGIDRKPRSIFNMTLDQREVDFRLEPAYRFTVENALKDEYDTLTITDTLDKNLTYIEGSAFQGGVYDPETESLSGGTALEPTITVNGSGCQVLTWVLENQKAGVEIEPIHYSCTIGTRGKAETDVKNGDLVKNTVSITAPKDIRPVSELYGKVDVSSFQVIMGKGSSLSKAVDKEYAELADNVKYHVVFSNNGSENYDNLLIRDILPYECDGRGTDLKGGTYKVTAIKTVTSSNAEVYVTKMKPSEMQTMEVMFADTDGWDGWTELKADMDIDGITAIAWKGNVSAGQIVNVEVEMEITCPLTRAVFANNVEAYTSNHQKLTSLKVNTTVLPRKLSGLAWFDADRDGIREAGEAFLAGVKVTLLDAEGNVVNDIYGKPVNAYITGADGAYQFDNLAAGEYQVRFESDTYKLDELLVAVKDSVTAGDEKDSDADGVYDGELLKAAVISGIELPELSEIVEENLAEWHEAHLDAGFHDPEPEETEPETTAPETTPSEPETTASETTPSYVDDDDDEPETTPTTAVPPTEAPTEPTLPTESITDIVPETQPLPYVDPEARPEDIPDEVVQIYYERYVNGDIDLEDIPFGVLGAFFEKGYPMAVLPATGERTGFWLWMMLISLIGLAVTSVIDRKRAR